MLSNLSKDTQLKSVFAELRVNLGSPHPDPSPHDFPCIDCKEGLRRGSLWGTIIFFFWCRLLGSETAQGVTQLPAFWAFRGFPSLGAYPAGRFPHPLSPRAQPAGQGTKETQPSVGWRAALPGSPENPGSLCAGTEAQEPSLRAHLASPPGSALCSLPHLQPRLLPSIPPFPSSSPLMLLPPCLILLNHPFYFFCFSAPKQIPGFRVLEPFMCCSLRVPAQVPPLGP